MTYRVQRSCGHGWEGKADHLPVPAFNTLTPMVHPAAVCWFPWFFMPPPPKQVSFSSCTADLTTMLNLSSARTHAPFCSLTFLPNVILALTENPSSKCVCYVFSRRGRGGLGEKTDHKTGHVAPFRR